MTLTTEVGNVSNCEAINISMSPHVCSCSLNIVNLMQKIFAYNYTPEDNLEKIALLKPDLLLLNKKKFGYSIMKKITRIY